MEENDNPFLQSIKKVAENLSADILFCNTPITTDFDLLIKEQINSLPQSQEAKAPILLLSP